MIGWLNMRGIEKEKETRMTTLLNSKALECKISKAKQMKGRGDLKSTG